MKTAHSGIQPSLNRDNWHDKQAVLGRINRHLEQTHFLFIYWLLGRKSKLSTSNNKKFVALVHERTIPTKSQPLIGEVSANFCG
jgi:hypothetical protein